MPIPLADLKAQYNSIKEEINSAINKVIESSAFIMGPDIAEFEKEFAEFCQRKYAIGVASGTEALRLSLIAVGINPNDEVITVPNSFIATAEAIITVGAKLKFVDVDEITFNIDVSKLKKAINENTKAIIPVHLYGQPADMEPIIELANENNLIVIEDCAQAHGAEYKNRKVPISNIGCFSFFPGKNLGAFGDAGAVVTDDKVFAEKIAMLRDHGRAKGEKYKHNLIGYNARMDTLQAAILRVKLRHLEKWNEKRRKNAQLYRDIFKKVILPQEAYYAKHVYHQFVIRTKSRDTLQEYLKQNGISTGIHYPIPLHLQPAYAKDFKQGNFPITEKLAKEILSLPMYPELSNEQIEYIGEKINNFK